MSTARSFHVALLSSVLFLGLSAGSSAVFSKEIRRVIAEIDDIRLSAEALGSRYLRRGGFRGRHYAEERLIDGENFYRMKDYQRAAIILMDIIENYPDHSAYPDALFLFADSLFLSRDYLGAREWFGRLLDTPNRPGSARFQPKAIGRLIEIAIHLDDYEGIEKHFSRLEQTHDMEARYIKGKYLYFKGDLEGAKREFSSVSGTREIVLKATYFLGVVLTRQGRYDDAIKMFNKGRRYKAETPAEQEIIDLLNLGAGRLYFEKNFVENASECYQRLASNSPYFDTALYEAASVLIRAGDTIRAERTLEVLTLAVPDSKYIPRAKLLRGNLLLRTGRYEEAEKVFEEMIDDFTPVMEEFHRIVTEQSNPRLFFADLVERSLTTLDTTSGVLPSLVVKWVGEEPEVQHALVLADDLGAARGYVRETERLVRLLEAVIDGPSRINAIPTLREGKRRAQQLSNRLGQLYGKLLEIEQRRLGGDSVEIQRLRQERRDLEAQLAALPTNDADFKQRDAKARQVYDRMRHELSRNAIRLDQLSAIAVAVERFTNDSRYTDGVSETNLKAVRDELARHRESVPQMRGELLQIKEDVESARHQVGVGDSRDKNDKLLCAKIKELARRERVLLQGRGGEIGRRLEQANNMIEKVEAIISRFERAADKEAVRQIDKIRRQVKSERSRVARYREDLRELNDEAEEVVGSVAFDNLSNVRKRFHELILKADVGLIDVAWLTREEHKTRIKELTKNRIHEEKNLNDEFQEVSSDKAANPAQ